MKNLKQSLLLITALILTAAPAHAEKTRISFAAKDGTMLSGILNTAAQPKALLLVVHGMQSHAEWFLSGDELAKKGITSLALDRRGSGKSGGARGHATSARELMDDVQSGYDALKNTAPSIPVDLHVNCFGTRIMFPMIAQNPGMFRSMIVTAPATHMSKAADYSFFQKISISGAWSSRNMTGLFKTPLKDELFVTNPQGLAWVSKDPLALRQVTFGFLSVAKEMTDEMTRVATSLRTPMLMILGSRDKVVVNSDIKSEFYAQYAGPKQILELNSEHALELSDDVANYRKAMEAYLLSAH